MLTLITVTACTGRAERRKVMALERLGLKGRLQHFLRHCLQAIHFISLSSVSLLYSRDHTSYSKVAVSIKEINSQQMSRACLSLLNRKVLVASLLKPGVTSHRKQGSNLLL